MVSGFLDGTKVLVYTKESCTPLLESGSVSTRIRICFYSNQSLFLLESGSVSTRIRVLLNPKETSIPLKMQHGSTLVV